MTTSMLIKDIVTAWRKATRRPLASALIVIVLALAVGTNAAVLAVAKQVLRDPLQVNDPASLVLFQWRSGPKPPVEYLTGEFTQDKGSGQVAAGSFSYPTYQQLSERRQTLGALIASSSLGEVSVSFDGTPALGSVQLVSPNYFADLGVWPALGRLLEHADDHDATDSAVITFAFWQSRLGGSADIIGRSGYIENRPFRIVGVAPNGFVGTLQLGNAVDVFLPIRAVTALRPGQPYLSNPSWFWLQLLGRLQPGIDEANALADLGPAFVATLTRSADQPHLEVTSGSQGYVGARSAQRQPLFILAVVCVLVLLMGCISVAASLFARTAERSSELAIRRVLGASRVVLTRHLIIDSLLYASAGGLLGLLFAVWTKDIIVATLMPRIVMNADIDSGVIGSVLVATAVVTFITTSPALIHLWRQPVDLRSGSRITGGGFRWTLAFQVALSVVPLVAAGLLLQTFMNLSRVNTGLRADLVTMFKVRSSQDPKENVVLARRLQEDLLELPGVVKVGVSSRQMLGDNSDRVVVKVASNSDPQLPEYAIVNRVAGDFFEVMGMRVIDGRALQPSDEAGATPVCVVNEAFRTRHFGSASALGQTVNNRVVVGVVTDAVYGSLRSGVQPAIFLPLFQEPARSLAFQLQTMDGGSSLQRLVHQKVQAAAPSAVPHAFTTISEQLIADTRREKRLTTIAALMSAVTLSMVALSLWGATTAMVDARTREIAIRLALGAKATALMTSLTRVNLALSGGGLVVGLLLAVFVAGAGSSVLYDVQPLDAATLGVSAAAIAILAIAASILPARKVLRVSPSASLRSD